MKDALGHGSDAHGVAANDNQPKAAAHQVGVQTATNPLRPAEPDKVQSYVAGAQDILNQYYAKNFGGSPHMQPGKIEIDNPDAPKFLRVVTTERDPRDPSKILSRSAHSFIDRATGNVLKPAGWKAPAKGPRGNIHDAHNGLGRMGPHGPAYNR